MVLTKFPDQTSAESMAQHLVAEKLAACVNILAPCTSIYHWQDKTKNTIEIPLVIKTTQQCYPAIEAAIHDMHPYELPEILYVCVDGGLPAYIQWIQQETLA